MVVANRDTAHTFGYKPNMADEWIMLEQDDPDAIYNRGRRLLLHKQAEEQTRFQELVKVFSSTSSLVVARPQYSERSVRMKDLTRSLAAAYAVLCRLDTLKRREPLFYTCVECGDANRERCDGCWSSLCTACAEDVVQCRRCR